MSVHIGLPNGVSRRPHEKVDWRHLHDPLGVERLVCVHVGRPNEVEWRPSVNRKCRLKLKLVHSFISHFSSSVINEALWQVDGFVNQLSLFKHSTEQILEETTPITRWVSAVVCGIDWTKAVSIFFFSVPTLHRPWRLLFCLRRIREPTNSKFGCTRKKKAELIGSLAGDVEEVFTSGNGIKGLLDCVGYSVVMFW